jgi:DNA-binding beta-propeller fold protein YncE
VLFSLRSHTARSHTAAFALALAGCAGANSVPSAPSGQPPALRVQAHRRGWLSPAAKSAKLIFVSDYSGNAVEIYPQGQSNPSPIGEITDGIDGPLGNFVDSHGTLYVANTGNGTVTEYPKGATSPSVTLSNSISGPISVAVDKKGTVAVGEFANGTILEFPKGSSSPTVTITVLSRPEGLAFDRKRNLYAAWNEDTGSGLVGQVSKCGRGSDVCVSRGISEGQSGGLAIDSAGNLILGDITNSAINIFAPGATSPTRTISTTGRQPYKFELDKTETTLYVADIENGVVAMYDYSSGTQIGTISSGLESAWGVSLYPAAKAGP